MASPEKDPKKVKKPDDTERSAFGSLVKRLVRVPKREIDQKARELEKRKKDG